MTVKELDRNTAASAMNDWIEKCPNLPTLDADYEVIRNELHTIDAECPIDGSSRNEYMYDLNYGLRLYEYLNSQSWFNLRVASNDGFWRYLSLMVVPDLVAKRWGKDNADHYWRRGTRIWLRAMWWYVHLAWQGDADTTYRLLSGERFNADTVLNLEERAGRNGTHVDVYRSIVAKYGLVDRERIAQYDSVVRQYDKRANLFRSVMKLNTAKMVSIEPALYNGGTEQYAMDLLSELGVAEL